MLKVKLRDFRQDINSHRGKDFYLVNGKGEIVYTVFSGEKEISSSGFNEIDRSNLNGLYNELSEFKKDIKKYIEKLKSNNAY